MKREAEQMGWDGGGARFGRTDTVTHERVATVGGERSVSVLRGSIKRLREGREEMSA